MFYRQKLVVLVTLMFFVSVSVYGQEITKEQVKGLDEQVQDIKGDVLGISSELAQLEEKLLYPSNTEVSVFVSLKSGDDLRLDSVEVQMDGKAVARHIYSFKELDAMKKGGVQRIYTGNVMTGGHDLKIVAMGKTGSGSDFNRAENFKVNKDVTPRIVEVSLGAQGINFKDR